MTLLGFDPLMVFLGVQISAAYQTYCSLYIRKRSASWVY